MSWQCDSDVGSDGDAGRRLRMLRRTAPAARGHFDGDVDGMSLGTLMEMSQPHRG